MFDDLKQDNTSPASNVQANQTPSQDNQSAPSAISKSSGGVDDMFGDVDPSPNSAQSIGTEKPSAVQSGKIKPISQTSAPANSMSANSTPTPSNMPNTQVPKAMAPNLPSADSMMVTDDRSPGIMRKVVIALLVVFLLAIVGGGVYYFSFRTGEANDMVDNNENVNNTVNNTNTNNVIDDNSSNINDDNNVVIDEDALDEDFDGLTNGEEKQYGTNPLESDSDNDGVFDRDEIEIYNTDPLADDSDNDTLSDHQEIFIYKTDPNDPDTDGDNFSDGVEIANGYNPLGEGKLEDVPEDDNGSNSNLNTNENL